MPSKRGQGPNVTEPLRSTIELDQKTVLRGLLDAAKVALGPEMPDVPHEEAAELLLRLLVIVDRAMPVELQNQDARVIAARMLADMLKQ